MTVRVTQDINSIEFQDCFDSKTKLKAENWNCFEHIIWRNVFYFTTVHTGALYGLYLCFTGTKLMTILFAIFLYHISLFGITAGIHRLWSHRSFKAVLPLRIILAIFFTITHQNTLHEWGRLHRVHHKYAESDADPVNSLRGFFFCHIGWLMCEEHPDVKGIGDEVDLSDILSDPVVRFQTQYYWLLVVFLCFLMPSFIPWYLWSESLWNAFFVCAILRYVLALNATFFVNSAAHKWGHKPYDTRIAANENMFVSLIHLGEGFHNFHHTFPWDYSASEWGLHINLTAFVLDQLVKIGWVCDRRTVNKQRIEWRKSRTGPKTAEYRGIY